MIKFDKVTFGYRRTPVLKDFDCVLPEAGITSIIGPNGCGKSTVLKLAAGMLRPDTGAVSCYGRDVKALSHKQLSRRVAFLQQGYKRPELTVKELVMYGRYPHKTFWQGMDESDIDLGEWAMKVAKCDNYCHKSCREISGGELQRAYIAMVLAQDSKYILLDEPTTYLDIGVGFEIMEMVARLNRKTGKTIIMVLHDLELALQYSRRILLMDAGCVVADGTPAKIVESEMINRVFSVEIKGFSMEERLFYCFDKIKEPRGQRNLKTR